MKAPLLTVAAIIALTGALESCGDSKEIAPVATATPDGETTASPAAAPSVPADLPTAAEGYQWFVAPASGFGLPTYDVQIPVDWNSIYPGDSNPRWFTPSPSTDSAGARFGTRLMIMVTPPGPWTEKVFTFELPWQGGGLCGILPDGEVTSGLGSWSLYEFKCPESETGYCALDDQQTAITCTGEGGLPLAFFDGRAAEIQFGDCFFSIVVFRPEGREDAEPAFQQAIRSLVVP